MKEEWKDVIGYEGLYKISSLGRIKSTPKQRRGRNHKAKTPFFYTTKEKILKNQLGGSGYWKISLYKDGKVKNHNIHRLMAIAHLKNPKNLPQVNHKDGDKLNCNINNLEWCTASENSIHAHKVIGIKASCLGVFGVNHPKSKPVIQVSLQGEYIKRWDSAMDAVRCGFTSSQISRCCKGQALTHKGFRWLYA